MGYTHYWDINNPDPKDMKKAMQDMGKICKSYSSILAGPDGTGKPIISSSRISFNGIDDDAHETFEIMSSGDTGNFCKTAQKPYDECVIACLAALKDCCKDKVEISSDGGDSALNDGASIASKILGRKVKISAALQKLKASVHKIIAENSIEFNGRNQKEIEQLLRKFGFTSKTKPSGEFLVNIDGDEITVFKDDIVTVKNNKVEIKKPSYVVRR